MIIKLRKGMTREQVNELVSEYVLFLDEFYLGIEHLHNWRCISCGKDVIQRRVNSIRFDKIIKCEKCKQKDIENNYKYEVFTYEV